jgi:gas vesicle protein
MANSNLRFVGSFVAGAASGMAAALLMAPASGEVTRRKIYRRLEDDKDAMLQNGRRAVAAVADRLESGIEKGKRKLADALSD